MRFLNPEIENYYQQQILYNCSYRCGFCNDKVSSNRGYRVGELSDGSGKQKGGIYICPNCQGPTFFPPYLSKQIPGISFGNSVKNVSEELNKLYEEARSSTSNNCHTAAVLVCRKILMNIAVDQGAKENLRFIEYVDYLSKNGFIPPNGKHWVDHIRKKGNEANHEITLMESKDSEELILFIEMLLKFIYEFPSLVPNDDSE